MTDPIAPLQPADSIETVTKCNQLPRVGEESTEMPECNIPPIGWKCSRGAGHEGPCAASPFCIHGVGWPGDCANCAADDDEFVHEPDCPCYSEQHSKDCKNCECQPIPEERAGREATEDAIKAEVATLTAAEQGPAWSLIYKICGELPAPEKEVWKIAALLNRRSAAQPSVQRDEDGIGWCSSCDKIHEVARPKCPSCGDWLIFAADDKPEDSAKSFNDGVKAATDYLRKMHYMHTLADLADKTVLRITAERGSK